MNNRSNPYKNIHNGSLFDLAKLKELGGYKAGDLLAVDPQLYDKFIQHLSKTVKRDEVTKNMVFSTAISAYTPDPINLFLRGQSSIGKTYNVVQVTKYFPKEDVWLLGGLSPTALVHLHGRLVDKNGEEISVKDKPEKPVKSDYQDNRDFTEAMREYKDNLERWKKRLEDSHYVIDLTNKILVFLEAPNFKTFNMLRPILSHDTFEISYKFADKSSKGQLQTQHVVIRGWPATIFCSTQEKYVQDLATRGFTVTPEATKEKYRNANVLTGSQAAFPWKFQPDFDFMLLQGYIRFLKNHLEDVKVVVPYAMEFAEKFPCRSPRSMRDFKHVLDLIKISASFHFAQRPVLIRKLKVEVEGEDPTVPEYKEVEERYIMAVRRDYDFAVALWNKVRETTETSAPGHIMKFYHEVVEEVGKDLLKQDSERGAPRRPGRVHVVHGTDLLGVGAQNHGETVPDQAAEDQNNHLHGPADQGHHSHRDEDGGQRESHRDDESHQAVHLAPEVSGQHPKKRPDDHRYQHAGKPYQQGDSAALNQAAQVVPPQVVRPQGMFPGPFGVPDRRDEPLGQVLRVGIVGSEDRREDRHHEDEEDTDRPRDEPLVPPHPHPHDLARSRKDDLLSQAGIGSGIWQGRRPAHCTRILGSRKAFRRSPRKVRIT